MTGFIRGLKGDAEGMMDALERLPLGLGGMIRAGHELHDEISGAREEMERMAQIAASMSVTQKASGALASGATGGSLRDFIFGKTATDAEKQARALDKMAQAERDAVRKRYNEGVEPFMGKVDEHGNAQGGPLQDAQEHVRTLEKRVGDVQNVTPELLRMLSGARAEVAQIQEQIGVAKGARDASLAEIDRLRGEAGALGGSGGSFRIEQLRGGFNRGAFGKRADTSSMPKTSGGKLETKDEQAIRLLGDIKGILSNGIVGVAA